MHFGAVVRRPVVAISCAVQQGLSWLPETDLELTTMDDLKFDSRAYDPAYINAVMRDARRMRNEVLIDLFKAIFDGRLTAKLFGKSDTHSTGYHGASPLHS